MNNTRRIVIISFMIAIEIILSRFLSISTPIVKIGFGFVPIAMMGILFGPLYTGVAAAVADIIGAILFPVGMYFPGFTLTAFLVGVSYGIFLYEKRDVYRIVISVTFICVVLHLGLNSFWLSFISGTGFKALILVRAVKVLIEIPIQVIIIYGVCYKLLYPLSLQIAGIKQ